MMLNHINVLSLHRESLEIVCVYVCVHACVCVCVCMCVCMCACACGHGDLDNILIIFVNS